MDLVDLGLSCAESCRQNCVELKRKAKDTKKVGKSYRDTEVLKGNRGPDDLSNPKEDMDHKENGYLIDQEENGESKTLNGESDKRTESIGSNLADFPPNYCTNLRDPKTMTRREYLKEFARGPCSPIILIPGLTASKLVVQIDCEELRSHDPETFSICGWNTCQKSAYEFWKTAPEKEYELWVPGIFSPMSIFSLTERPNFCFFRLTSFNFDFSRPASEFITAKPGRRVFPAGFSPLSRKTPRCGAPAMENLLPFAWQTKDSKGFKKVFDTLETLGFRAGLSFQPLPYNFLLTVHRNEVQLNFKDSLERLLKYTGKKTVIFSHSMGNTNVLHFLSQLSQPAKKALVLNWLGVAPALTGSPGLNDLLIGGYPSFSIMNGRVGLHFRPSVESLSVRAASYDLMAREPFKTFEGQPWIDQLRKRLNYEQQFPKVPFEDSGLPFWPPFDAECHPEPHRRSEGSRCALGIIETIDQPILTFNDKDFAVKDMPEFLKDYAINEKVPKIYEKLVTEELMQKNPGVPVVLVFGSMLETGVGWSYRGDKDTWYNSSLYHPRNTTVSHPGDNTLSTTSQLMIPLRWALEFDSQKQGSFPVKFFQFCSAFKNDQPLYDLRDPDSEYRIKANGYVGLRCECMKNSPGNFDDCSHGSMHTDSNVIGLLLEAMRANQRPTKEAFDIIDGLAEEELADAEACKFYKTEVFGS